MKKKASSLVAAAMVLTMAWLTGCDDERTESSISETAANTAATAVETTAIAVTESAESVTAAESEASGASNLSFDNYDDFLESVGTYYPGVVLVAPSQIASGEWEITGIYFLHSGTQPSYEYTVKTPDGDTLLLSVSHEAQYASPEELKTALAASESTVPQDGYSGTNWMICKTENPEAYVLYGLTGDENASYTLLGADTDGNTLLPDVLQSYRDTLHL